ncbi:restriction endonuclease subunit S [Pseudomonas sp. App30]|uniref:restriction endonuclease subunit S n=1 Tax=Pseudomonas sp. App30 TaxID=3068990 RepID=UPI003A7F75F3
MSQYKPYPAYKDSGVEWLGRVPAHWTIGPYKATIQIENGSDYKDVEADDGYPVIGSGGPFAYSSKLMYDGESVLLGRKGTIDKPLYINGAFWAVDTMYWSVIKPKAHGRFAYYIATTIPFDMYSTNTALPSMTKSVLGSHVVAFPGFEEQQSIAGHLDRDTARIDALIEKKTRFIQLLSEKRQALITHAVTKGLDSSVKMKDSGVEWLGEVPEHWGVKPLKLLVKEESTISYGIVQPGDPLDEGVPFVQTTNMSSGDFEIESLQKTTPEIAAGFPRSRLAGGEVILGIRASIGAAFVVPKHLAGVNLSRGVARIDCSSELSSHFLVAYLSSVAVDGYWQLAKQGSTFNEVSIATVKELLVPVPPSKEQADIEGVLSKATARLNSILNKTERSIDLLKERRAALITAAVTGQIDLREAV